MKQGEIWMVDFDPSTGHEFQKQRPAIIVTSNEVLKYSNLITIMPITSNTNGSYDDDIRIMKDEENRLFTDSVIKVCYVSSFDKDNKRFIKKIGVANEYIIETIKKYLIKHFSIEK